jgi:hypothetical protein
MAQLGDVHVDPVADRAAEAAAGVLRGHFGSSPIARKPLL